MVKNREEEIWAIALWVEKQHGPEGPHFIADRIGQLALAGDTEGKALWLKVAERFETLLSDDESGRSRH